MWLLLQLAVLGLQMTPDMVTCTWVQCLCFVRRAQSLKDARQTFLKASKVPDIGWQVRPPPLLPIIACQYLSHSKQLLHMVCMLHVLDGGSGTPHLETVSGRRALSRLHSRNLVCCLWIPDGAWGCMDTMCP